MPQTPNHGYNVPNQGAQDWHQPLNQNFEDYDTDIELRDTDGNKGSYEPKQGAKFLATDTGIVYTGDGTDWVPTVALPRYVESGGSADVAGSVVLGHRDNEIQNDANAGTIAGGGGKDQGGNSVYPNVVTGNHGAVGGGKGNTAGFYGRVGGGNRNEATGDYSTVAGGVFNSATGNHATAAGGWANEASGAESTVAGGAFNVATGEKSTIAGGGNTVRNDQDTANAVYDDFGTVGGGGNNTAGTDDGDTTSAPYATVSGGQENTAGASRATVGGGLGNVASDSGDTVGGGKNNVASGGHCSVGGGANNEASTQYSTVAGGSNHVASGSWSAVTGGFGNVASGDWAQAAGDLATAANNHSFVWNDGSTYHGTDTGFSSASAVNGESVFGDNTFNVSASGGARFVTGESSVTYVPSGGTGFTAASSRAVKTNVNPVEPESALDGVESLEVATWEYETEDGEGTGTTHIGPMAEDFHAAFDVGSSDEHINSVNADGVALAAIQGLSEKVDERDERIEELEDTVAEQRAELQTLRDELDALQSAVEG